jgi:hypothetical protein
LPIDLDFREQAVSSLTRQIGVYILADLDNVPVYVGGTTDGIRGRVRRHLTSARSDIIVNRQIDVWEIAFVWEYPVSDRALIKPLEAALFHHFDPQSRLMNGKIPAKPAVPLPVSEPAKKVQVLTQEEIGQRLNFELRLLHQANHYAEIVKHFLTVKRSKDIARVMDVHFERLKKYHEMMLLGGKEKKMKKKQ